jgi:hypothetical protein
VKKQTEEREWFMHGLILTVCGCRLRKLLNCNSFRGIGKMCIVRSYLHITYTRTIMME